MSEPGHFRGSPRPQVCVKVEIGRKWSTSARPLEAFTEDVSEEGVFVVTDEVLEPGERVRVVLSTPTTWEPLQLDGEVAWHRGPKDGGPAGVGVHFVGLDGEERRALRQLVATLEYEG